MSCGRVHEKVIIIRDPSETHCRPQLAPSGTNIPHQRLTCRIGDQSETDMPHLRPICPGDPLQKDIVVEFNQNLNPYMYIYLNIVIVIYNFLTYKLEKYWVSNLTSSWYSFFLDIFSLLCGTFAVFFLIFYNVPPAHSCVPPAHSCVPLAHSQYFAKICLSVFHNTGNKQYLCSINVHFF